MGASSLSVKIGKRFLSQRIHDIFDGDTEIYYTIYHYPKTVIIQKEDSYSNIRESNREGVTSVRTNSRFEYKR